MKSPVSGEMHKNLGTENVHKIEIVAHRILAKAFLAFFEIEFFNRHGMISPTTGWEAADSSLLRSSLLVEDFAVTDGEAHLRECRDVLGRVGV